MRKVVLVILDGWGLAPPAPGNAITAARTPFMQYAWNTFPHSTLITSGEDVGLPQGQMGNSEVGHLNIGAGRIVWQELANINKAVRENTLISEPVLQQAFDTVKHRNCKLHFIGLVSDGGVHSHIEHLKHLCTLTKRAGINSKVYVHAFTDGRDTDPNGGKAYLEDLDRHLQQTVGEIATITGRYYAMDRDKRWERVKIAYDALVHGHGHKSDWRSGIKSSYQRGITDEFIQPVICNENGLIEPNDVVICFNFRTDRCREITQVLTQEDMPELGMVRLPLYYVTMTRYDDKFKNVQVIYEKDNLGMTLGEVLEKSGKKQIRIAETEKYPHVTFFFSGGREIAFNGEKRLLIPSAKVATYDLKPEMSAVELKDAIVPELSKAETDFVCLNFANADMVGHTGNFSAAVKAVETVDTCLKEIVEAGTAKGFTFLIIADHGNADTMINPDGSPNTAHTTHPVPCILVTSEGKWKLNDGRLADIAPTILELMDIPVPDQMTGKSLLKGIYH